MTTVGRSFALLLLLAFAICAQSSDGVISGTVRNTATRIPLEGAQVSLTGVSSDGVETDGRGAFRFTGLAPGWYTVRAEKPGFTGGEASRIEVRAGAVPDPIAVDLFPLGQIEGSVVDEDGAPVKGVVVEAANAPYRKGVPFLRAPATEAGGRFQLANLYPRDYVIRLWLTPALRAAGYPAVEYYPGVSDVARAATIHIAEGAQIAGFPIRLRRVPLVNLKGKIVDGSKDSAVVEVALDCEPGPIAGTYGRRPVDAEGRFHFDGIPPGRHTLLAYRGTDPDDLPYTATVDVGDEEVRVTVPAFVDLHGTAKSSDSWEGMLGIGVETAGSGDGAWRHNVIPDSDGAFTLSKVPPGDWTLRLESNALRMQGHTLRVASARFGAVNVLDKAMPVTESGNPAIVITLSAENGRIAGTVEDGPQPDQAVVVAARFAGGSKEPYQTATTGAGGSFLIGDLLPGEYQLSAWGLTAARQGVFGTDCTGRIAKVTVVNGQTATLKLQRCGQ